MIIAAKRYVVLACALVFSLLNGACQKEKEKEHQEVDLMSASEDQLAYLDKKIEENPNLPSLYVKRGDLRLEDQEHQAAIADFKEALKLDSTNKWAWYKMGKTYRQTGSVVNALKAAKKAEQFGLKDQGLFTLLGECYFLLKKYDKALLYLNNSLKMNPYEPEGYYYKGLVYRETGDTAKAISSFQTAIEQEPGFFDAYNTLAETFMKQGNWKAAQEYLETGLTIKADDGVMYYNLGVVLQHQGNADSARIYYKKALDLQPKFADAAFNFATLYFQQKIYDSAAHFYNQAWKARPGMYKAAFQYALSLDYTGKDAEAKGIYEQLAEDERNPFQRKAQLLLRKFQPRTETAQVAPLDTTEAFEDTTN